MFLSKSYLYYSRRGGGDFRLKHSLVLINKLDDWQIFLHDWQIFFCFCFLFIRIQILIPLFLPSRFALMLSGRYWTIIIETCSVLSSLCISPAIDDRLCNVHVYVCKSYFMLKTVACNKSSSFLKLCMVDLSKRNCGRQCVFLTY